MKQKWGQNIATHTRFLSEKAFLITKFNSIDSQEELNAESAALETVEGKAEEEHEPDEEDTDTEHDEQLKQQLNDYIESSKAGLAKNSGRLR